MKHFYLYLSSVVIATTVNSRALCSGVCTLEKHTNLLHCIVDFILKKNIYMDLFCFSKPSYFFMYWTCRYPFFANQYLPWQQKKEGRLGKRLARGFHYGAPPSRRGLATLRIPCLEASQDPWPLSGSLTAVPHACKGSLPTSSLLIFSKVKPTLGKSRESLLKPSGVFYPIT